MIPLLLLLAACSTKDDAAPAFLHLDAIHISPHTEEPFSTDEGFYTSAIVAAHVVIHYPGDASETNLGCYRLPFTIPVRRAGEADYIIISPAVAHSGIMSTLPYYTYFETIRIDHPTLPQADTLDLGDLGTHYDVRNDFPLLYEPFEWPAASVQVDSVQWVHDDPQGACTGNGYGLVHVEPTQTHKDFAIDMGGPHDGLDFYVGDASKLLYLEMDIRSSLRVQVRMTAPYRPGSNNQTEQVMVIYPTDQWTHLYINLERTWSIFNHSKAFSVSFSALNADGTGGDVCIDNLKLLTTSKTL